MDLRKDVLYYDALVDFPSIGQENKLYLNKADGSLYYWDGAAYQLAGDGSGGVTSVTASAPLASSGGATPNISLTVPGNTTTFLRGDGTFAAPPAVSTGRFGIADSNGAYTYYATLSLAMTAAVAGQTIEMFADVTETGNVTIQLKNGVNINGNGHTYTHSYSAGNSNTFENSTGTVSCIISNIRIIRTGRANGTSGDYVFLGLSSDSQFYFEGVFMESTYGNGLNFGFVTLNTKSSSGTLYVKAYLTAITTQTKIEGFIGESTTNGFGIYVLGGYAYNCVGKSVSNAGIHGGTSYNSLGVSTSGAGLDSGLFYNCVGTSVSGFGSQVSILHNCSVFSSSSSGAHVCQGSNNTIISSTGSAATDMVSNRTFINSYLLSSGNVVVSGVGDPTFKNCTLVSNWNNVNGHAITSAANTVVNCSIKVANTSANCLYRASATNMRYTSNVFEGSTTPVNANITQTIINTQDNQGNILL